MPGLIEVIDGKIGNSIQDAGRFGYRHMGITVSGCLDSVLARCANALVGNAAEVRLHRNPGCSVRRCRSSAGGCAWHWPATFQPRCSVRMFVLSR